MTRPKSAVCACGAIFDVKHNGPVPKKCPDCRRPAYARAAASRKANRPAVGSVGNVRRGAGIVRTALGGPGRPTGSATGPTVTSETDYTADEVEFGRAVDRYKRAKNRPFPALSELLAVLRELGYRKAADPNRSD